MISLLYKVHVKLFEVNIFIILNDLYKKKS